MILIGGERSTYVTVRTHRFATHLPSMQHIHLNDDQSWPLEIEGWPRLAGQGAYSNHSHTYTHADIRDLVSYAGDRGASACPLRTRSCAGATLLCTSAPTDGLLLLSCRAGVRVVPEFDSPSHFGTLERSYKEFTAEAFDSNNASFACLLDPTKQATFDFLSSVWGEIASIFPDEYLGLGGDEWWCVLQSCPTPCPVNASSMRFATMLFSWSAVLICRPCWDESPTVATWMKQRNMTSTDTYYYYERALIEIARSVRRHVADFRCLPVVHALTTCQVVHHLPTPCSWDESRLHGLTLQASLCLIRTRTMTIQTSH